ncbi:MAG: thioredoxin-disulfide reductase [Sphaerochaetaceae bacterium]|nr:thioredoxin-disulfide reductase [Sphaerochaetaceae bacterium]
MRNVDAVIIGAGPAGITSAIYLKRYGYDIALLDPMGVGGQLMMINEIENYPGFKNAKGFKLAQDFEEQLNGLGGEVEYTLVKSIEKSDGGYLLHTDVEDIATRGIIIASGAKHSKLNIPGENEYEGKGVSYCATCDGPFFKNKKVVVVGGGDTALTDALYLAKLCSEVVLIHRRDQFRAQKILQDRVFKEEKIKCVMKANVVSINGEEKVKSVTLDTGETIETDGIFIFTGIIPTSEIFKDLVEMDKRGFVITNGKMETSAEGIFAAGDVRTTALRQVVTATGDGAVAASSMDEYLSR